MKSTLTFTLLITMACLYSSCIVDKVAPNEKGVLFKRYEGGLNKNTIYGPGFHFVAPWDRMYKYDITTQQLDERISVLSKNGLTYTLDMEIKFHCDPTRIGFLHEEIGISYPHVIVKPAIRNVTREKVGMYMSVEIESIEYSILEKILVANSMEPLEKKYILLDTIIIHNIDFPKGRKK